MSDEFEDEDDFGGRSFLDGPKIPVQKITLRDDDHEHADTKDTRNYLITGGRTGSGKSGVEIETIVVTMIKIGASLPSPEAETIQQMCIDNPLSVSEISAHTHLPLGVCQVLVGDLVSLGILLRSEKKVNVHKDVAFIERLISRVSVL